MLWLNLAMQTALAAAPAPSSVRVPEDFPTIQAAIDGSRAPRIFVGPGDYAGAYVTRPVRLEAVGSRIVSGPAYDGIGVGFALSGEADGAQITGFTFDCGHSTIDVGVYASARRFGSAPDRVTVHANRFVQCVQGVANAGHPTRECTPSKVDGGVDWRIDSNAFEGIRSVAHSGRPIGGIGILLFNASFADVVGNTFSGRIQDSRHFTTSGVLVAGCWDCSVVANGFTVTGGSSYWSAVSNMGFAQDGAAASRGLVIADNDARYDTAPNEGVNYRSFDSFDVDFTDSRGVVFIDHTNCGDQQLETFERR
jgi:hypothetical protein